MDTPAIVDAMWSALDNADSDAHIGVRGDNAIVKSAFRKSWNRPNGVKTTRIPGVCVVYVGYNNITRGALYAAVLRASNYGQILYLLAGDSPTDIQAFANDPYERILTSHKILFIHRK